jgi:hypothetical protein
MRFTTGVALGIAIGWIAASRVQRQEVELEARREAQGMFGSMTRHPSAQRFGRRVADLAGERGAEALRRARANIQRRLETNVDDLSMN